MTIKMLSKEWHKSKFCIPIISYSNRQTTGNLPEGSRYRNGTCLTEPECTQRGGSESGTCAGG